MNEAFLNSDLLTRLRGYAEADILADTCTEAADEIERLRAEVVRLGSFIHPIGVVVNKEVRGE